MNLTKEQRRILLAICEDHRQCLREVDFSLCGRAVMERLRRHGIEPSPEDIDEVEGKARVLWQTDQMIRLLGGTEDKDE